MTVHFESVTAKDSVNLYSLNDTPKRVKLYTGQDSDPETSSTFAIVTYDDNDALVYKWYFSNLGNVARQIWDSTSSKWTDSSGTADAADYYVLKSSRTANYVFATPNAGGKGTFRALVSNDLPVVPIGKGGTGQTSLYDATHSFGMSKTAGDTIGNSGYVANGYLTDAKRQVTVMMCFPWIFNGSPTASLSGTVTIRQNGIYLFGSTASTAKNLSGLTVSTSVMWDGRMLITLRGTADSSAKNNDVVSVYFNSLTITLS